MSKSFFLFIINPEKASNALDDIMYSYPQVGRYNKTLQRRADGRGVCVICPLYRLYRLLINVTGRSTNR